VQAGGDHCRVAYLLITEVKFIQNMQTHSLVV
jgi:hypothetical protein